MPKARSLSFVARQARRYARIFRRGKYVIEGALAAPSRLDAVAFRRGQFKLDLLPQGGTPYGWVLLRLSLCVAPTEELTDPLMPLLEGLTLEVCSTKGRRRTTLTVSAPDTYEAVAFLPPERHTISIVGLAFAEGHLKTVAGDIVEVARQEASLRALWPHIPKAFRDPHKITKRLSQVRQTMRRDGLQGLIGKLASYGDGPLSDAYLEYRKRHDQLTDTDRRRIAQRIAQMPNPPAFSVLLPTYNTDADLLDAAIRSVTGQLYPHWELCIADDASTDSHVRPLLEAWAKKEPRIRLTFRTENGHIAAASNSALALAQKPWIALLDHDDCLSEHALYMMAEEILLHPQVGYLYSDEDKLDLEGERCQPFFKPDYNPDLLLSQNYVTHLSVYDREVAIAAGGFRPGYDGSQDYDLVLRVSERLKPEQIRHVPFILYHWRLLEGSAALSPDAKPYAYLAAEKAIQDHLDRTKSGAYVRATPHFGQYKVRWPVPQPAPLVSILIPTRDRVDLLNRCIDSILINTAYRPYEIIILDNGSRERRTQRYFRTISRRANVRVVAVPGPFNFAAINNVGAQHARGTMLALLNNDIEVLDGSWLDEMVSLASRPHMGAVGARLVFANGCLQHMGIVLGLGGIAANPFVGALGADPLYFGRGLATHNVSAVTAACMVVKRDVYQAVGGMDERFAIAYNDVDFCLRLSAQGYRHVVTPHATLIHHESSSRPEDEGMWRQGFADEFALMTEQYGDKLEQDPFYNPNLTLASADYALAIRPRRPYLFRLPEPPAWPTTTGLEVRAKASHSADAKPVRRSAGGTSKKARLTSREGAPVSDNV